MPGPPPARFGRLIVPVVLLAASAAVAVGSLSYARAFHRALTFHRVQPWWPGCVLPAAAAACAVVAIMVTASAKRWAAVVASLIAALPILCTGGVLHDHGSYGPHDSDTGAGGLHQIGLGLLLYAEDHGHVLPPDLPTLVRAVGMGQAAFVGCEYDGITTNETDPGRVATMIVSPLYNEFM